MKFSAPRKLECSTSTEFNQYPLIGSLWFRCPSVDIDLFIFDFTSKPNDFRLMDYLQLFIFIVPFQICVLDYPVAVYTKFVLLFNATCIFLCVLCYLHKVLFPGRIRRVSSPSRLQPNMSPNSASLLTLPKPEPRPLNIYLAGLRAIVYISTAVCIFARDQPCWNNNFSKSHSFGTGVMDIGLGCFIVCVGSLGPTSTMRKAEVNRSLAMKKALVQFVVLSVLGIVKTVSIVLTRPRDPGVFDDVWSEYGVHWNAFYSLAVAKLAGTALELHVLPARMPPVLGALLAGLLHEALLARAGLAEYVLAPGKTEPHNRASLFGANREGICSTPGLMVLYLVGLQIGRWTHEKSGLRLALRIGALLGSCLVYRVLLVLLPSILLPESRRLLNLSYTAWIAAFVSFCLLNASCLVEIRSLLFSRFSCPLPLHLRQVDSVGLLYFLVSNLLTGLGNMLLRMAYPNREETDGLLCFLVVLSYSISAYPLTRLADKIVNLRRLIAWLSNFFYKKSNGSFLYA